VFRRPPTASIALAAIAALTLAACEASVPTTAPLEPGGARVTAAVLDNAFIPFNLPYFNSCTGRTLIITGTLHVIFSATTDANGGYHQTSASNFQNMNGVDTETGIQYRVISTRVFTSNANGTGQEEDTAQIIGKLVGQGPFNNTTFRVKAKLTVNANGAVTASFSEEESSSCR
jgi:hypothetical protein